jgi:nitrous oxidase accessory protein NosD
MLSGSIMFLRPSAEYVVRLSLNDPDGGSVEREVKVATLPVPDYGQPVRTLHVVPRPKNETAVGGDGSKENPFRGIEEADKAAKPGDLFLLHAGDYGAAVFKRSGELAADRVGAQPKFIVWKGAGDGPAVFNRVYVEASATWFEGLTFKLLEEKTGFRAADTTAENVVRANTFRGFSYAIFLSNSSRRWYISDNDIIGDATTGIGGEGVELNHSPDHTVCYNRVSKTADGTSYMHRNCDVFGNDVFDVSDDGVEPDYGYANIRIWGNRLDAPAGITFQAMY